jgi:arsenical pump membrane protein
MATVALRYAGGGQGRLFLLLYLTVSVLTVFTSNDIIILSFTPFICYFAKNAHIDPMPYLAAEFVAANTFSMALSIGNPTNIYLSTAAGVDFLSYARVMLLPTLAAGVVAPLLLFLLYRRSLRSPLSATVERERVADPLLLSVGLLHLSLCTLLLAVGSYLSLPMWAVALGGALSLFLVTLVISAIRRRPPAILAATLRRVPFELVPFVLSMFVSILVLGRVGVTAAAALLLSRLPAIPAYGLSAFLAANLVNNIPMSVLFSGILEAGSAGTPGVFATVIASNLGAYFTPIGALAGMMWTGILRRHGYRFSYRGFLLLGVTVALPTLAVALLALAAVV